MKRAIWTGGIIVGLVLIVAAVWLGRPFYLDRTYYRGPVSGHFDGERFFNPEGDSNTGVPTKFGLSRAWAMATGARAPGWPEHVAVTPGKPPARVHGQAMRVTWIGHATVLVQTRGLNILTDPIWSDVAGPWNLVGLKRVRAPGVRFNDLPKIESRPAQPQPL